MKPLLKKIFFFIITFVLLLAVILGLYIILAKIMEIFMPEGWLFYEVNSKWLLFIDMIIVAEFVIGIKKKLFRDKLGKKFIVPMLLIFLMASYGFMTNVIIFTDNEIIVKNSLNPKGT